MTAIRTTEPAAGPDAAGLLLVDKPADFTSHDVVAIVRRAAGTRRVGHAGTLDPFATGLLVLLLGRATRLVDHLQGEPKVYEATIAFGAETTTDDRTGDVAREAPLPADAAVDAAIASLTGTIAQVPPSFSAKQVEGVRAHRAARSGQPLDLAPVQVTVHEWTILERSAKRLVARITCGGGTYIRALARDLGRLAGSAAHLDALRRTRSGVFDVRDAVSLDAVRARDFAPRSPLDGLPDMPRQILDEADAARVLHGAAIAARAGGAARVALLDAAGRLLAIGERKDELVRPIVVLADA